jgi:hypothetical protein
MRLKEELKPCPACLTPIPYLELSEEISGVQCCQIACSSSDCLFTIVEVRAWNMERAYKTAVAAWNRRKTG